MNRSYHRLILRCHFCMNKFSYVHQNLNWIKKINIQFMYILVAKYMLPKEVYHTWFMIFGSSCKENFTKLLSITSKRYLQPDNFCFSMSGFFFKWHDQICYILLSNFTVKWYYNMHSIVKYLLTVSRNSLISCEK